VICDIDGLITDKFAGYYVAHIPHNEREIKWMHILKHLSRKLELRVSNQIYVKNE